MKLFFLRHGIAEDAVGGKRDYDRALTQEGRDQLELIGRALSRLGVKPDVILSSPLVRARETAEIVARFIDAPVEQAEELQPGCLLDDLLRLLGRYPQDTIVVVGHQPDLAFLAARLINADERGLVLKKGGLIRVETVGRPQAGRGRLVGLLTPKMLLLMADATDADGANQTSGQSGVETATGSHPETTKEPNNAHDYGT